MKKVVPLTVVILFILSSLVVHADNTSVQYHALAEDLQAINLLKGSNQGFELGKALTRSEAAVMVVRLLGKEQEVLGGTFAHPFTDVPNWANNYVGYLYLHNITNGVGDKLFGSTSLMSATQYATFILRVLGYDDKKGDFRWDQSLEMAVKANIILPLDLDRLVNQSTFNRDDMVLISYNALKSTINNGTQTLIEKLIDEGVVNSEVAIARSLVSPRQDTSLVPLEKPQEETMESPGDDMLVYEDTMNELEGILRSYYTAMDNLDLSILQLIDTNNPSLSEESWIRYFDQKVINNEKVETTLLEFNLLELDQKTAKAWTLIDSKVYSTIAPSHLNFATSGGSFVYFTKENGDWIIAKFSKK